VRATLGGQQAQPTRASDGARPRSRGIDIEETGAVERDARQHAVVEGSLINVREPRVAVEQGEPVVPLGEGDRGAGFLIGGEVRQIVVLGESFVARARTDAPVMYILRSVVLRQTRFSIFNSAASPVSAATSVAPLSK